MKTLNIFDFIETGENTLLKILDALRNSEYDTFIYENAVAEIFVEQVLMKNHIPCAGKLVTQNCDVKEGTFFVEDFLRDCKSKINLIIARENFNTELLEKYADKMALIIKKDFRFAGAVITDSEFMTLDFLKENSFRLNRVFNNLNDEWSQKTLVAFINQKLSMNPKYMRAVKSNAPQYFEKDLLKFSTHEVFIDCGAYVGDSVISFINFLKEQGINSYDRIISFEPNETNYQRLTAQNFSNHLCIKAGVYDRKGTAHFKTSVFKSMARVDETGEKIILMDTIDNVLAGSRATFIKMDIEGAEAAALRGAKETIKKYRPTLAISIYHKRTDLWEIPEYIAELVMEYKFYIRAYADTANELIFYAII